jgi:hypothetical protein
MKQITVAAAAVAAAIAGTAAHGQQTQMHDGGEHAAAKEGHSSGLGEIMSLQQMRHSKLWFAGNARNWDLAGYESDELKEGFEEVAKLFPTVNDVSVAPVFNGINDKELSDLGKAIAAHDFGKFLRGFDRLTAACNACHQTTKYPFIVIQRPTSLPYTNQSFAPSRQSALPAQGGHHH